jgi:hypothetical protein
VKERFFQKFWGGEDEDLKDCVFISGREEVATSCSTWDGDLKVETTKVGHGNEVGGPNSSL